MEKQPLVSIIIPTYSRPGNISRSIDSVLSQTYKNIEIIVVDDNGEGTPCQLETESALDDYIKNKKIIYIKHDVNKNGSAARNTGFRACHGEYVIFLDDDDVFMEENVQSKVCALVDTPSSVGASFSPVCYIVKDKTGEEIKRPSYYKKEGNILEDFLIGKALFNTSGILFKSETLNDLNGFDESFIRHQDFEIMIRFFRKYTIKLASSEPLYYMDLTSCGSHHNVIKNRFRFEQEFLSIFKDDLVNQNCYHSVSHFLYWQCCIDYLSGKDIIMFFKSVFSSLRHGLFSYIELKNILVIFLRSYVTK